MQRDYRKRHPIGIQKKVEELSGSCKNGNRDITFQPWANKDFVDGQVRADRRINTGEATTLKAAGGQ